LRTLSNPAQRETSAFLRRNSLVRPESKGGDDASRFSRVRHGPCKVTLGMSHDILRALCFAGASILAVIGLAFARKDARLKLLAGRPSAPIIASPGSMVRFATGRQLAARRAFARRAELASADNVAAVARRA
jgi:hypothetical protein